MAMKEKSYKCFRQKKELEDRTESDSSDTSIRQTHQTLLRENGIMNRAYLHAAGSPVFTKVAGERRSAVKECTEKLRRKLEWNMNKTTGAVSRKKNGASTVNIEEATSLLENLGVKSSDCVTYSDEEVNDLMTQVNTVQNAKGSSSVVSPDDALPDGSEDVERRPAVTFILTPMVIDDERKKYVAESPTSASAASSRGKENLRKRLLKSNLQYEYDTNNNSSDTGQERSSMRTGVRAVSLSSSNSDASVCSPMAADLSDTDVACSKLRRFVASKFDIQH